MEKNEIEFVDGLSVKAPKEGRPDFVKASISIKRAALGNWLRSKQDEWINIDVKVSKAGNWYCEVNNWKPEQPTSQEAYVHSQQKTQQQTFVNNNTVPPTADTNEPFNDDIPF